jgi:hypothetical protein
MGKSCRFRETYAENASKNHKIVGDLLKSSIFKDYKIYQEYPVNRINPKFPSGREKFDWFIKDLNLVIEIHGEFHYFAITIGGISEAQAEFNLARQKVKDAMKEDAALNAGATYIIIKYDEEINEEMIISKILSANNALKDKITCEIPDNIVTEEPIDLDTLDKREREIEKKRRRLIEKEKASARRKMIREQIKQSKKYQDMIEKSKEKRKLNYKMLRDKLKATKVRNGKP